MTKDLNRVRRLKVLAFGALVMGTASAQNVVYLPSDPRYLAPPPPPPPAAVDVAPPSQSTQVTKPKPKPESASNIPLNPTREQIIASCIAKPSIQERSAFQQTKTRMEAAEILQSIYQNRYDFFLEKCEQAMALGIDGCYKNNIPVHDLNEQRRGYKAALLEVNELIEKLGSEPAPTPTKRTTAERSPRTYKEQSVKARKDQIKGENDSNKYYHEQQPDSIPLIVEDTSRDKAEDICLYIMSRKWDKTLVDDLVGGRREKWISLGFKNALFFQLASEGDPEKDTITTGHGKQKVKRLLFASFKLQPTKN